MTFARPELLLLLWALPLWVGGLIWSLHRRERAIEAFAQAGVLDTLRPRGLMLGRRWQAFWWTLSFVCFVTALSQPRVGFVWRELEQRGIDLVVALDVSTSMNATDIAPSRMERARREVLDLLAHAPSDRVGLVVFAGGAYPRLPLTLDHDAVRMVLRETSTKTIRAQGSSFDRAIDESVSMLSQSGETAGAILLITDGEAGDVEASAGAAERAAAAGISVYGLLIGTDAGAPIPLEGGGFKKSRSGEVVVSRARPEVLQAVARSTGGAVVRSVPGDGDVRALVLDEIHSGAIASTQRVRRERVWNERFQLPLLLGLFALAMAGLAVGRPRRMDPRIGLAATLLLATLPVRAEAPQPSAEEVLRLATDAQARAPDDPYAAMELGEALYRAGRFNEAERAWEVVAERARDPKLQAIARYNMGNAAYRGGRLVDAIEGYGQALELDPDLSAAEANGQAVAQELQRRMQPPEDQQSEDNSEGEEGEQSQDEQSEDDGEAQEGEPQSDATSESSGEREEQAEESQEPLDLDQLQQQGGNDTGGAPPDGEAAYAAGEQTPPELSEEQARRLLEAVDEGVPHVVVGGDQDGEQDW